MMTSLPGEEAKKLEDILAPAERSFLHLQAYCTGTVLPVWVFEPLWQLVSHSTYTNAVRDGKYSGITFIIVIEHGNVVGFRC